MTSEAPIYPPRSDRPDEIEAAVKDLARQYGDDSSIYLSTPITTGKRYYDFLRGVGKNRPAQAEMLKKYVIQPNMAAARVVRERLAAHLTEPVIDPTAIDYPQWNQSDYKVLWAKVIERLARGIVYVDGWEYSNGCAFEFLTALRVDKPNTDEYLQPIPAARGAQLIENAIQIIVPISGQPHFLIHVLEDLRALMKRP